ncbi:MAG: hypothetical protein R2710_01825 [Acidimicrobiales bacterium]
MRLRWWCRCSRTLVLGVAELGFHVRDMQRITAASQAGARSCRPKVTLGSPTSMR